MLKNQMANNQTQSEKFKRAAHDLECDPDGARSEHKLRKVVKPKPAEKKA
jgi:hypothetical protein